MKMIVATRNKGKLREFKSLLEPLGYQPVSLDEAGIDVDVEETGETFEENARLKAKEIRKLTGLPVIADDSGLEVEYLNGAPGVYSARWAGEGATDEDRNKKLLEELENVPTSERTARFVCTLCCILNEDEEYCVRGTLSGFIGTEPRGNNGFGYDPIFMIDKDTCLAEVDEQEKNRISHRADAMRKMAEILKSKD